MYIKISTGTSFRNAAIYNERGLSEKQQKQKRDKVAFLGGYNLLSEDAVGIAAEMDSVASRSRTKKAVWNVSLSVANGQHLTDAQWLQAVEKYLKTAGIDVERHQVAVWRHSDTGRDHAHALVNSVPTDGKRALKRYHNGKRAKEAAEKIDTDLAQPIFLDRNIKDELGDRLENALLRQPTNTAELKKDLAERGVIVKYLDNAAGIFGVTFQLADRDHQPVAGSDLKIEGKTAKWKAISARLEANRAEYQAEINKLHEDKAEAKKRAEIAEKARQQAVIERDQARNQPAKVEIREVTKEVIKPDPTDKARIEQLKEELEHTKGIANRNHSTAMKYGDRNEALEKENKELNRKLQAKPAPELEISERLKQFYSTAGTWGAKGEYKGNHILNFLGQARQANAVGVIAEYLAKDFANPGGASQQFEKRLNDDYERQKNGLPPFDFVRLYRQNPSKEQSTDREITADSVAWQSIVQQSNTFPPTQQQIFGKLQEESLHYKSGIDLKTSRQLKI